MSIQLVHLLYSCVSVITFSYFKRNTWKILSSHDSTYSPFKNMWNVSVLHRKSSLALSSRSFWYARSEVSLLLRKENCLLLCSKGPLRKTYFHLVLFFWTVFKRKPINEVLKSWVLFLFWREWIECCFDSIFSSPPTNSLTSAS